MHQDRFGQPVTAASARAVALNDDAVDRMFALQPGAEALVDAALAQDPRFALAHCTKARTLMQAGETEAGLEWARRGRDLAASLPKRERLHAPSSATRCTATTNKARRRRAPRSWKPGCPATTAAAGRLLCPMAAK